MRPRQGLPPFATSVVCLLAAGACNRVDVYAVTEEAISHSTEAQTTQDSTSTAISSLDGSTLELPASDATGDTTGSNEVSTSLATSSSDCSLFTARPGNVELAVDVAGMTRTYVLHVPPAYDGTKPAPLIVDFHGMGGSGESELTDSPYPSVTDPEGVVIAFPDGEPGPLGTAWNMGPCCVEGVDDVAFARALVAHVQQQACIDSQRVYAVGVLTGGGLVNALACEAADIFAAAAPAAFDLLEETVGSCAPARPITVVSFRGTDDTRVPYEGGASSVVPGMPITFLGAMGSFNRWAQINGCNQGPSELDVHGCTSYSDCSNDVEVVLCTKQGGRSEPGDPTLSWPILKRHSL